MNVETLSYRGADDKVLAGYRWTARDRGQPVGVVMLIHGMGEHIRRYEHVAEVFAAHGFIVYGHDHRGHGTSLGPTDVPGHLGDNGWHALVDDLKCVIAQVRSLHPRLPVVVVAHSMGSFATQQFLLDHAGEVDAVALTGTAAIDLLEPALDLSADLELSAFNAAFTPARTDFDWISRDDAAVDAYLADPLCGFGIDASSLKDMFAGARRLADPVQIKRIPLELPIYLAVGSQDPVNAGLTLLWALVDRYRSAGLKDVTVRVYEQARHEVLNETNRAEVIDELVQWLLRVSASAPFRIATDATQETSTRQGPNDE